VLGHYSVLERRHWW